MFVSQNKNDVQEHQNQENDAKYKNSEESGNFLPAKIYSNKVFSRPVSNFWTPAHTHTHTLAPSPDPDY